MNYLYVAIAVVLFGGGFYLGGLRAEKAEAQLQAKAATQMAKVEQTQVQQEAKQLQTDNASEAQYVQDLKNAPPLILKQPVWLHSPTVCPSLPSTTAPGGTAEPTPSRPADPGPPVDLRPELAAFAAKYEAVIAGCREGARDVAVQTQK